MSDIHLQSSTLQNSRSFGFFYSIYHFMYTKIYIPYIWKAIKVLIRLYTGKTEIERICSMRDVSKGIRALFLYQSLKKSTKLIGVYNAISSHENSIDLKSIIQTIVAGKHIREGSSYFNLEMSLSLFYDYNVLLKDLEQKRLCKYDKDNIEHEKYLEELWNYLMSDKPRKGRITEEWEDIGFQGNDPATDFRGMGLLGLLNLHYFAKTYPIESKWVLKSFPYPFSITGINISGLIFNLISSRKLLGHFLVNGLTNECFHELYCRIFYAFAKMSIKTGETSIMSFPFVFSKFVDSLQTILNENNGIISNIPLSPFKEDELYQ